MMNNSLIQLHSFSLPKFPSSSSTSGFSSNYNINNRRRRCRFTRFAVSASSVPLLDLPLLPFPKEQVHFRNRIGSVLLKPYPFCPLFGYPSRFSSTLASSTVKMVSGSTSSSSKRPVCPECSKPIRVCLCTRFKTPRIENSVAVTILQHSLERKHPLNSTRIASLGLANVYVVSVSDVLFGARFVVGLFDPDDKPGHEESRVVDDDDVGFTIEKYGAIRSITGHDMPKDRFGKRNGVDQLLSSILAAYGPGKGFRVSKFQKKELYGNAGHEEVEEFKMEVPPGSVLLFPSEKSVGIEAIDFEVTNIIVLDGTWAKARRMYDENPWLKHLPHLRLDLGDVSLYREVRHQPKAGCMSTIESIVYTLKALGEDSEKLGGLLEVFESMVGDQRRCKDERLRQVSAKPSHF